MLLTSKYKSALMVQRKTLLLSKFCCILKSKVSKRGVHSVVRLQKKRGGTAIIPSPKSATASETTNDEGEADVDCRQGR